MASELILILCDFFSDDEASQPERTLPRLPVLETLLAKAHRSALPQGWRGWLTQRFGGPRLAARAPAAIAAMAWLGPRATASQQYWLATPVSLFAGLDSVRLHPAGLLQLPAAEQTALAADFAAVFGAAPWALHAIGRRELLLSGSPLAASAADPAQYLGRDPAAGLPRGPAAATLRRLGVEIEMWLHQHRVNGERQQNAELPVSGLWLWGSDSALGEPPAPEPLAAGVRLFGEDAFAEALWRLRAGVHAPLAAAFEAESVRGGGAIQVVLYPTADAAGLLGALQNLERHWLEPALQALRAGSLSAIELLAGSARYRVHRFDLARFWRASRPWWEALA